MSAKPKGVVAAGHPLTVEAAELVLRDGGNAFDATLAALSAACVVEPTLASLGGGGFLLAQPAQGAPRLYDFFVHTPARRRPESEIEFRPIIVDFGSATQEFHIGKGAIAVPGLVKGLFEVHHDLASMPMPTLVAPARTYALEGARVTDFHAYTIRILTDILSATAASAAIFRSPIDPSRLVTGGEVLRQPDLADALDALSHEGSDLFYRGEMARSIVADLHDGGHLTAEDLERYRVEKRHPLSVDYHSARLLTNPPPSSGGLLIAFALKLLEAKMARLPEFGSAEHVMLLAETMELTSQARIDAAVSEGVTDAVAARLLHPDYLDRWRRKLDPRARATRGTTHLSVIDGRGNIATLSVSNGEGSSYIVPGSGISLNNMLGEQDLNPSGFHRWPAAARMTSMMAPSIVAYPDGRTIATGSGGSNRIRTAILQVILNLVDFQMDVERAVHSPRVHYEKGLLSIEGGFEPRRIARALEAYPDHKLWEERNMFFGGAHTVARDGNNLSGAGDPRRDGSCVVI